MNYLENNFLQSKAAKSTGYTTAFKPPDWQKYKGYILWSCCLTNNNNHSIYARTVSCGRDFTKPRHFLQFLSTFLCADCPRVVVVHTDQKNNVMMVKFVLIFPVSRVQHFSKKNYCIKTNRHILFMFYVKKVKNSSGHETGAAAKIVWLQSLDHFDLLCFISE